MKLEDITILDGSVKSIENIIEVNNNWKFINSDPQIFIEFDNPVIGIRIEAKNSQLFESDLIDVFFHDEKENYFTENKKIQFRRRFFKNTKTDVVFGGSYKYVRLDLEYKNVECSFDQLSIKPIYKTPNYTKEMEYNFKTENNDLLFVTHDLSNTGAPILAFNIIKTLQENGYFVGVVNLNSNKMTLQKKYIDTNINVVSIDGFYDARYDFVGAISVNRFDSVIEMKRNLYWEAARNCGISKVITNTVVSGAVVNELKDYGFLVVSLIHEMKNTINYYGFMQQGEQISKYSDYIIFPDETVKNDFEELYPEIYGKLVIRPQGVYLNRKFNEINLYEQSIYSYLGDTYVMGSGTAELRKGVDLFVNAAIILGKKNEKIKFVWTGDFHDLELKSWLDFQIEKSGMKDRIHFIPFISNSDLYKNILSKASAFWLVSREDPFPSVALEAMSYSVPVLGFESGGFATMAQDNRGTVVNEFNIADLVDSTISVLTNNNDLNQNSIKKFCDSLSFDEYVKFLQKVLESALIVQPDFNVYTSLNSSKVHYSELQNRYTYEQKMQSIKGAKTLLKRKVNPSSVVLLDTEIGSDNVGDAIIMSYCDSICENLFTSQKLIHVPTHIYDNKFESVEEYLKILCGTNIIYKHMEDSKQMVLPYNMKSLKNSCLLGVGMQQLGINEPTSEFTVKLLQLMLKNNFIHSVRDEETFNFLNSIGIKNVLNTGCPTMWNLTREHCEQIPSNKSNMVLTTITDYAKNETLDAYMLNILTQEYSQVYFWVQGLCVYNYVKNIFNCKKLKFIAPTLKDLDDFLDSHEVDYIGTRLHAGIRCLNKKKRSLVIGVDNRARAIHNDTNLPLIEREDLPNNLLSWIRSSFNTKIEMNFENIDLWKAQFEKVYG